MKVLLTGGGTGGHITPILAVAHELKQLQPDCETIYVGERGSKFVGLTANHSDVDEVHMISAGKFRRYNGESWIHRILDIKTNTLNLRDGLRAFLGIFQALRLLRKIRPDIVFLKGGFVGVPVGLAAAFMHIPIVTHDSDALPGLANRLISRWVYMHATALPAKYYPYPESKVRAVGVLVEHNFQKVNSARQQDFKKQLRIPTNAPVLLVTGGSLGAERINKAVVKMADELLENNPYIRLIHQVGKGKTAVYGQYQHNRLTVLEFLSPMYVYTGAADLVIARASGNTIAELGTQGKACIVVPNPDLAGGHQIKNAQRLEEQGTAIIVTEDKLYDSQQGLAATCQRLLSNKIKRDELALNIQLKTINGAARQLAAILLDKDIKT